MTLVAAYRSAEGGVLLCADREENDGWLAKRSVDKIYPIHLLPCDFYLAGAGPTPAIVKTNELIHSALSEAFAKGSDVLREFKTLMHPNLMGLQFKFLALEKNLPPGADAPLAGFQFSSEPAASLACHTGFP